MAMEDFKKEALKTLKLLLKIEDDSQDELLLFFIDDVINSILGYCRIDSIPTKLESSIPIMTADLYRRKMFDGENIKSISEGERSVTYEDSYNTDDFIKEYSARLNPFINRSGRVPSDIK